VIGKEELAAKLAEMSSRQFLRLCLATRLEAMKGCVLAIEALAAAKRRLAGNAPTLAVLGEGPEREALASRARELDVADLVSFRGTFPYGKPFFDEIRGYDLMLLTNLNSEQPRILFDSISQGLIPLCPDHQAYTALRLGESILYSRGDAGSLAAAVLRFQDPQVFRNELESLVPLTQHYTIEHMHEERARWIADLCARTRRKDGGMR